MAAVFLSTCNQEACCVRKGPLRAWSALLTSSKPGAARRPARILRFGAAACTVKTKLLALSLENFGLPIQEPI